MSYTPPPGNMPPPPPGAYGATPAIPGPVNTAAILLFISGGFGILGGLLFLLVGSISAIFVVVGLILLAVSGVEIWVGVALRQLKEWARTTAMVLAGISAVFSLITLIRGGYTSIVGLAIDFIIIYLLTRPESVQAFLRSGR